MECQLEEFVQIVEIGSVSAAARALSRPRISMSRRLASLEASLGVELLHREPHQQTLTQAGTALYQRARKIVAQLQEARQAVWALDDVPRGLLRVGMPSALGVEMALAKAYQAAYPEVTLEFSACHAHGDLVSNRIDVALRAGPIEDERLIGRKLTSFRNTVYGAPEFLEKRGTPTLEDLSDYPCILGFDSHDRPDTRWPIWAGGCVDVQGAIRSNDMVNRIEGARMGLGLTMASERLAREWVEAGQLKPVLVDVVGSMTPIRLVWPATEFMDPKVRAFIDLATEVIDRVVQARGASA